MQSSSDMSICNMQCQAGEEHALQYYTNKIQDGPLKDAVFDGPLALTLTWS